MAHLGMLYNNASYLNEFPESSRASSGITERNLLSCHYFLGVRQPCVLWRASPPVQWVACVRG